MRKVILGIGNTLNHDEGLGVHALDFIKEKIKDNSEIEIIDGGTLGLNLLQLVESCSHLLILDTIDANKQPGTLIEMKGEEISLFKEIKMSEHQITFQEVLGLSKIRGKLPNHLHLLGIQPYDVSLGVGLSDKINETMPTLVDKTLNVIENWN